MQDTPIPQGLPEFSDEQVKALTDYMIAVGKSRGAVQGADFSEVDFLAGCMTTLFALGKNHKIPAGWIFGPMRGESALGLPTLDQDIYVVTDPGNHVEITVYTDRHAARDHVEWLNDHGHEDAWMETRPARHALHPKIQREIDIEDILDPEVRKHFPGKGVQSH